MIRGNIIKRRFMSVDNRYVFGKSVELTYINERLGWRWLVDENDRGMHHLDLYVEVYISEDELNMLAMLHPVIQVLLSEGRLTCGKN